MQRDLECLLDDWEERAERGECVAAEDLCSGPPEVLAELRRRIDLLSACDAILGTGSAHAEPVATPVPSRLGYYEVRAVLGRGGCGVVYKAWDPFLKCLVAIKCVSPARPVGQFDHDALVARYHREAEFLASLEHPHIVPVRAAFLHERQFFLVMGYMERGSLAAQVGKCAPSDLGQAAALVEKVARAVHYAHEKDIFHRDLKPDNILIDSRGEPRVADFGLAKLLHHAGDDPSAAPPSSATPTDTLTDVGGLTLPGSQPGTPAYMAPEQYDDTLGAVGAATDVWALGVILHEVVTGKRPCAGANRAALQRAICSTPPDVAIPARGPKARRLENIVRRCLEKDPSKRYPTALALADDLAEIRYGRVSNWLRRHQALAAAILFCCIAAFVTTTVLWSHALSSAGRSETARASLEQALSLLDRGEVPLGLHRLVRTLELTPATDTSLQRVVRANLGGWRQCLCALRGVYPQSGPVLALTSSLDRRTVLIGTTHPNYRTGEARLLDAETGRPVLPPLAHGSPVHATAISADGLRLATGADDGTVRLWRADTGQPIGDPMHHVDRTPGRVTQVTAVAFHPDGRFVVSAAWDGTVKRWDAATAQPLGGGFDVQGTILAAALSPDGKTLAVACSDAVTAPQGQRRIGWAQLWDMATGQPQGKRMPHESPVKAIAFHPDGKSLLTGGEDKRAQLWDATTTEPKGPPLLHEDHVQAVAFSANGQLLFTGIGTVLRKIGEGRVWNAATGRPLGTPLPHQHVVRGGGFSQDGKSLVTVSHDMTVRRWDLASEAEPVRRFPGAKGVQAVAFSPDGLMAAAGSTSYVTHLWDMETGKTRFPSLRSGGEVFALAFRPGRPELVTGSTDGTAQFWDLTTGEKLRQVLKHAPNNWVTALAFRRDGQNLLTGVTGGDALLWTMSDPRFPKVLTGSGPVVTAAFSPVSNLLVTGTTDGRVQGWDGTTGERAGPELDLATAVRAVGFAPDGASFLTAGDNNQAQRWQVGTWTPLGRPLVHTDRVWAACFSPNGATILTASARGTAQLWDAATDYRLGPPFRCQSGLKAAVFRPAGSRQVLTGDGDGAALWQCPSEWQGDVSRLRAQVEAATGFVLKADVARPLDATEWDARQKQADNR